MPINLEDLKKKVTSYENPPPSEHRSAQQRRDEVELACTGVHLSVQAALSAADAYLKRVESNRDVLTHSDHKLDNMSDVVQRLKTVQMILKGQLPNEGRYLVLGPAAFIHDDERHPGHNLLYVHGVCTKVSTSAEGLVRLERTGDLINKNWLNVLKGDRW